MSMGMDASALSLDDSGDTSIWTPTRALREGDEARFYHDYLDPRSLKVPIIIQVL